MDKTPTVHRLVLILRYSILPAPTPTHSSIPVSRDPLNCQTRLAFQVYAPHDAQILEGEFFQDYNNRIGSHDVEHGAKSATLWRSCTISGEINDSNTIQKKNGNNLASLGMKLRDEDP